MADVNNPDDTILGLDEPKEKEGSYEDFSSLQGLVKERFFKLTFLEKLVLAWP